MAKYSLEPYTPEQVVAAKAAAFKKLKWPFIRIALTSLWIERTPDGHQLLGYSNRWHEATATK